MSGGLTHFYKQTVDLISNYPNGRFLRTAYHGNCKDHGEQDEQGAQYATGEEPSEGSPSSSLSS